MGHLNLTRIEKSNIFCEDFRNLTRNNEINFSASGIAVIYGPNGVGKSSFTSVLGNATGTILEGDYEGNASIRGEHGIFHIISDQNGRNIIQGETEDFLLGDDIRRERLLFEELKTEFIRIKESVLIPQLKETFNISKRTSRLATFIIDENIRRFVQDLANKASKGKEISLEEFIEKVTSMEPGTTHEYDIDKMRFFFDDIDKSDSIIARLISLNYGIIQPNERIHEVGENSDAIDLLSKYPEIDHCIICDNADIDPHEIIIRKQENKEGILSELDPTVKELLVGILTLPYNDDPFGIKNVITSTIQTNDFASLSLLRLEIEQYRAFFNEQIGILFAQCLANSNLVANFIEHCNLLETQPTTSDEDFAYIRDILRDNLDKDVTLERETGTNNIKILLSGHEILGQEREKLNLSAGEQNFVSLTFELLKAKNSTKDIIILDDPISSFDSIYKNKIAYAILKTLERKRQIILTHNTDLIRILECQQSNCYNLYLLNNAEDQENGFIAVNTQEKEILLYINKFLDLLRSNILDEVINERLFLISLVPFMRGYAQIIGNAPCRDGLTNIMHGYGVESTDLALIYSQLFNDRVAFTDTHIVTVTDILDINDIERQVILRDAYPLLHRTLQHSITYLYLRLFVERELANKFSLNTTNHDQLGRIIRAAFPGADRQRERVFLMSRKTLLNEFNHFEGNMNIFQPAIDISELSLRREKIGIVSFIENLNAEPN